MFRLTDSNSVFTFILVLVLALSLLFLLTPVTVVVLKGLKHIPPAASSEEIRFSLLLSLKTTTVSTVICMAAASVGAYAMRQLPSGAQRLLFSLISIPMSLPHLVSGVALLLVYGQMGIGSWLYTNFGLDFVYTEQGVILALVFVNLSYAIILMYSAGNSSLERLEFTARTLGCSKPRSFIRVTIPLTFPAFFSTAVMTWSRALGEFGAVIMIAGSTRMKTEILPTAIYLNMATGDLDTVLGISSVLILVSVVCIAVIQLCIPGLQRRKRKHA